MLTSAIDSLAPEKDIRIKSRTEPWMDNEILNTIREKHKIQLIANKNKIK